MLRLDIGPGDIPEPGYMTVSPFGVADLSAPMWDLPFAEGEVDELRAWHSLEHVATRDVPRTLTEWNRVLRPGGVLDVMVPDLDYVCRYWLGTESHPPPDDFVGDWALAILFGLQSDEGQYHKTGFNAPSLRAALDAAGFRGGIVEHLWSHGQECLRAIVTR